MSKFVAKELLKKEEKYTEIQAQLEESTRKILAEYAKYREVNKFKLFFIYFRYKWILISV